MKTAERIVMVLLLLALVLGCYFIYSNVMQNRKEVREAVARGEYEIPDKTEEDIGIEDWQQVYPNTVPMSIGDVSVRASVADNLAERIEGLSDTPFLPEGVVKLFVFGALGNHSIWMKDMNYSIDIIWATEEGKIVHIEEKVSPDTYPESFESPTPAWFVIETNAGFVASSSIKVGDSIKLLE